MPGMDLASSNVCSGLTSRKISCLKTPQLLELSGIGRRDVLEKANIPIHVELPGVGENVQEHIFVGVTYGELYLSLFLVSAALIQGPTELKPDVDWYTIDIHRDQELLAKHVEMQYVGALTPPQWRDDTDYAS